MFVDKQENADILLRDCMKASYPCRSLHGGIDQFDRDSTIVDFKSGTVKLLIATSVAARGLDVKQLILVVNYDCPNHYEDYVHRCGRTGRAGRTGYAWTFLTPEQGRYAGDIVRALELSGVAVPEKLQQLWDTYRQAQEAEGKKVHTGGGFSGRGFKFDDQEAAAVKENKKMQKAALGLQDSDEEDDLENDIDQQIESMFAAKRNVKEVENAAQTAAQQQQQQHQQQAQQQQQLQSQAPGGPQALLQHQIALPLGGANVAAATTAAAAQAAAGAVAGPIGAGAVALLGAGGVGAAAGSGPSGTQTDKYELAKRLASRINIAKNLGLEAKVATQQTAEAIFKGGAPQPLFTVRS